MQVEEKSQFTLRNLLSSIRSGTSSVSIRGLSSSSKAFFIVLVHCLLKKKALIITPTPQDAETLYSDLIFFSKNLKPLTEENLPQNIFCFPHWETAPYEKASPYPEITATRLFVLERLTAQNAEIVLISPESLLQKFLSKDELKNRVINIETGMDFSREKLFEILISAGYQRRDMVEEKGDFSSRGGIVDIFTPSAKNPFRIEFYGDEVVSVRKFDLYTQKSINRLSHIDILPAREVFYSHDTENRIIEKYKKDFSDLSDGESYERILGLLNDSVYFPGIENYIPLFLKKPATIFDYISDDFLLVFDEPLRVKNKLDEYYREISVQWEKINQEEYPAYSPSHLYISPEDIENNSKRFQQINFSLLPEKNEISKEDVFKPDVKMVSFLGFEGGADRLKSCFNELDNFKKEKFRVYFVCSNEGYGKRLEEIFGEYNREVVFNPENRIELNPSNFSSDISLIENTNKASEHYVPKILTGKITGGFEFDSIRLAIISEEEIFGKKISRRFRKSFDSRLFISDFGDISSGDFLVHIDYGIGKFQGTKKIRINDIEKDFLSIEYFNNEILYVPVESLNLVQKYIGMHGHIPKLDYLGGKGWERVKERAKESIRKMAEELLGIYARRKVSDGFTFSKDDHWMSEFESIFEYEETPHQLRAIEDVKKDMESFKPMDRLICGDVGYGKTEIALRAAFKAASNNKQVAMLVPTTILAQQHYQTFLSRFSPFPMRVEVLSRFCSSKKEKEIIEDLKNGKVDIVIGTHRLLSDDIEFSDIGLVVIDEEQRFGVKHKEKLKKFRNEVDVLTLTATPIPRTLQLSLMGIRDMSIIDTPPEDRQPIKTIITAFNKEVIAQAIKREMERSGQVYFVHNRVKSIHAIERFLKKLLPSARIGIAHGQMKKSILEEVMMKFIKKEYDVLLCSAIIESGLDIPAVNTIIINRAERFGLADLYQLRGRVGRTGHVAYAYLLIPPKATLAEESKKRLKVIEELSELGSGFKIAAHDLEIRGAGDVLGEEQSGHILAVGFDLYCKLIEEAISEIKGVMLEDKKPRCLISSSIEAYIPERFIEDSRQRIMIYKRLSEIESEEQLKEFKEEVIDRFGEIPEALNTLFKITSLRILGNEAGVSKIDISRKEIRINFSENFYIPPDSLTRVISERKDYIKFYSDSSLSIRNIRNISQMIEFTWKFLKDVGMEKKRQG